MAFVLVGLHLPQLSAVAFMILEQAAVEDAAGMQLAIFALGERHQAAQNVVRRRRILPAQCGNCAPVVGVDRKRGILVRREEGRGPDFEQGLTVIQVEERQIVRELPANWERHSEGVHKERNSFQGKEYALRHRCSISKIMRLQALK